MAPAAKSLQNEQFGQSEPITFLRLTPNQLCNSGSEWINSFNCISPRLSKLLFTTSYHVPAHKDPGGKFLTDLSIRKANLLLNKPNSDKNKSANEKQNKMKQEKKVPLFL